MLVIAKPLAPAIGEKIVAAVAAGPASNVVDRHLADTDAETAQKRAQGKDGKEEPSPISASVPKFARTRGTPGCELRNQRDTSKHMILVPLPNPKFAIGLAAQGCKLRFRGTCHLSEPKIQKFSRASDDDRHDRCSEDEPGHNCPLKTGPA